MDDNTISVTLTGPAKVNGVREPSGKTVTVTPTLALQLAASGVINPELAEQLSNALDMSDTALESDFQKAVEDTAAGRIDVLMADHALAILKLDEKLAEEVRAHGETKRFYDEAVKSVEVRDTALVSATERMTAAEKLVEKLTADLASEAKARTAAEKKAEGLQAKLEKTPK